MDMSLFNWRAVFWLWCLPMPWLLYFLLRGYRLRRDGAVQRLERYADIHLWSVVLRGIRPYQWLAGERNGIRYVWLPLLGLSLLLLALAGPRWSLESQTVFRDGADIDVILDMSRSMRTQDIRPDRLIRAREELHDLLARLNGDRVALTAFAGHAFTLLPLTTDYDAILHFSERVDDTMITHQGSNLAAALDMAVKTLQAGQGRGRAVVLITDGEDDDHGRTMAAMQRLVDQHIPLFILGMGTTQGGLIPTESGRYLHHAHGRAVLSHLHEYQLEKMAAMSGGVYAHVSWDDRDWNALYDTGIISMVARSRIAMQKHVRWREYYPWLLLPGMLCLAVWWVAGMRQC